MKPLRRRPDYNDPDSGSIGSRLERIHRKKRKEDLNYKAFKEQTKQFRNSLRAIGKIIKRNLTPKRGKMNNQELSRQLVAMAKELISEDEEGEGRRVSSRRRLARKLDLDPNWKSDDPDLTAEEQAQEMMDVGADVSSDLQGGAYSFQEALLDIIAELKGVLSKESISALKQQYKAFRKVTGETTKILNQPKNLGV